MIRKALTFAILSFAPVLATAGLVTFDLWGAEGADVDGLELGTVTIPTYLMENDPGAYVDTTGVSRRLLLNQTTSGLGINVEGVQNTMGCSKEDSDGVDQGCLIEFIYVSFDQNVVLESVLKSGLGNIESAQLNFERAPVSIFYGVWMLLR